jgi:UDP-N-acetylglucosamine:LPS N-acetylglucosamine transferase
MCVAFFTRGWGRGHAVPDMAIVGRLLNEATDVDLRFVSYGTGSRTLRSNGYDVLDLELPDMNPFLDTIVGAIDALRSLHPELVIAHEEAAALIAARGFSIPSLFITDFFQDPSMLSMRAVEYAREVLFVGEPHVFTEPPYLAHKTNYLGAVLRPFSYSINDRTRARAELGLPTNCMLISCMPGSWSEAACPIADLLVGAFDLISQQKKHLVWLAGNDYDRLSRKYGDRSDLTIKQEDWTIDRLMVASDIVITKSNRVTLRELNVLGVPSIALSHGVNWPDDVIAARIKTSLFMDAKKVNKQDLARQIENIVIQDQVVVKDNLWLNGLEGAVTRIKLHIDQITSHEKGVPLC